MTGSGLAIDAVNHGAPLPGFASAPVDAQRVFRAILGSFSFPTREQSFDLTAPLAPPTPLAEGIAAVLLTLCDSETTLWLDPVYRTQSVEAWLTFHTGVRLTAEHERADFVAVSSPPSCPPIASLAQGTDADPHISATVVIDVSDAPAAGSWQVSGPGIQHAHQWNGAGLTPDLLTARRENPARFPRGVDLILAGEAGVVGLPRTTRVDREAR